MKTLRVIACCIGLFACTRTIGDHILPEVNEIYVAACNIEGALSVGASYAEFNALVLELSKALVIARNRGRYSGLAGASKDNIANILSQYGELLQMYADSSKVWRSELQNKHYDREVSQIAENYAVPSAISERPISINFDVIRQAIWSRTAKIQKEQTQAVFGRTVSGPKNATR